MEEVRRVLIFCASPKRIAEAKKHYKPMAGDEEHFLFNYKDVLNWISVSKILEKSLNLAIIDLEKEKGNLLLIEISREFPGVAILGIHPSKIKEP